MFVALIDLNTSVVTPTTCITSITPICNLVDIQEQNVLLKQENNAFIMKLAHAEELATNLSNDLGKFRAKNKSTENEMNNTITSLRFQNRKTLEENSHLLSQIHTVEETVNTLNIELEECRGELNM